MEPLTEAQINCILNSEDVLWAIRLKGLDWYREGKIPDTPEGRRHVILTVRPILTYRLQRLHTTEGRKKYAHIIEVLKEHRQWWDPCQPDGKKAPFAWEAYLQEVVAKQMPRHGYEVLARECHPPGQQTKVDIVARHVDTNTLHLFELKADGVHQGKQPLLQEWINQLNGYLQTDWSQFQAIHRLSDHPPVGKLMLYNSSPLPQGVHVPDRIELFNYSPTWLCAT